MSERKPFLIPEIKFDDGKYRDKDLYPPRDDYIIPRNNFNSETSSFKENLIIEDYLLEKKLTFDSLTKPEQYEQVYDFLNPYRTISEQRRRDNDFDFEILAQNINEIFLPLEPRVDIGDMFGDVPLPIPANPSLTPEERERLATDRRVAKLRNPHFQSLLRFVRATPHLWDQIQAFQKRRDMLLQGTERENENHRQFTPILAGMAVNSEARAYLQIALDEAATDESESMKRIAEINGGYYAPVLVIGAGIHGSIFNAQLLADRPDVKALTVDQEPKLGGTFRKPNGPAFSTNSRNRAEDRDLPKLPGTPGNINSMGEYATMQVSDTSADVYANNDTFGLVTALNQYLSGNTMLGVEVKDVVRNRNESEGKYKVTLEDEETGRQLTVTTDVIVTACGLGERRFGLDMTDTQTAELLVQNFEKAIDHGTIPQVIPYDILLQIVGDRSNQFPLEPFIGKRIAVAGDKDSGNTSVESLLGLGPEYRGSVAQMGRPQEIVWYGPKFKTQEEYKACTRTRYSQIGLFLPKVTGADATVQPLSERVTKMRRTPDGKITVISNGINTSERNEDFDFVILATGFEDQKAGIFRSMYNESNFNLALRDVEADDNTGRQATIARQLAFESIYFIGPTANIPVSNTERLEVEGLSVPENSVAIWRYSDRTAATARLIGMDVKSRPEITNQSLSAEQTERPQDEPIEFTLTKRQAERMFPPEINYANLLKMQTLAEGSPTHENTSDTLSFTVEQTPIPDTESAYSYRITVTAGNGASTNDWIRKFINNELNRRLLAKLAKSRSGSVSLQLPIGGYLTIDDIVVSTRTKRESK